MGLVGRRGADGRERPSGGVEAVDRTEVWRFKPEREDDNDSASEG